MQNDFHVVAGYGVIVELTELYERRPFNEEGDGYASHWKFNPVTGEPLDTPVKGYDPKKHLFYEYPVFYNIDPTCNTAYIFFNYLELDTEDDQSAESLFQGRESAQFKFMSEVNSVIQGLRYLFIVAKVKPPTPEI